MWIYKWGYCRYETLELETWSMHIFVAINFINAIYGLCGCGQLGGMDKLFWSAISVVVRGRAVLNGYFPGILMSRYLRDGGLVFVWKLVYSILGCVKCPFWKRSGLLLAQLVKKITTLLFRFGLVVHHKLCFNTAYLMAWWTT